MPLPEVVELSDKSLDTITEASAKVIETAQQGADNIKSGYSLIEEKAADPLLGFGEFFDTSFLKDKATGIFDSFKDVIGRKREDDEEFLDDVSDSISEIVSSDIDILSQINLTLSNMYSLMLDTAGLSAEAEFEREKASFTASSGGPESIIENLDGEMSSGIVDKITGMIPFGGMIAGLSQGLTTMIGSSLGALGLGALVVASIGEGIRSFFNAENLMSGMGITDGLAGITAIFTGIDGDIMSQIGAIGRWAAAGAVIGSVVPVFGTMAGGLVGALIGGVVTYLTDWIGFENIVTAVDDFLNSTLDFFDIFSGTNVERLEDKLSTFQADRKSNMEEIEAVMNDVARTEAALAEARATGQTELAETLEGHLLVFSERYAEMTAKNEFLDERVAETQSKIDNAHSGIIDETINFVTSIPDILTTAVGDLANGIMDQINKFMETEIGIMISSGAETVKTFVTSFIDTVIEDISRIIENLSSGNLVDIASSVLELATYIPSKITEFLLSITEDIRSTITEKFLDFKEKAFEIIDPIVKWFEDIFDIIKDSVLAPINMAVDGIQNAISGAQEIGDNIAQGFKDTGNSIANMFGAGGDNSVADNSDEIVSDLEIITRNVLEPAETPLPEGFYGPPTRNQTNFQQNNTNNTTVNFTPIPSTRNPDILSLMLENGTLAGSN